MWENLQWSQEAGMKERIRRSSVCVSEGGGSGGSEWCQSHEERMSIVPATAPQWGVNHMLAANGPSFHSHALLIYSTLLPSYLSPSLPQTLLLPHYFYMPFSYVKHHPSHLPILPVLSPTLAVLLWLGNSQLTYAHKSSLHSLFFLSA